MNLHEVIHEYLRLYKISPAEAEKFLTDVIWEKRLLPHIRGCVKLQNKSGRKSN